MFRIKELRYRRLECNYNLRDTLLVCLHVFHIVLYRYGDREDGISTEETEAATEKQGT
jgi:hypothetical protein